MWMCLSSYFVSLEEVRALVLYFVSLEEVRALVLYFVSLEEVRALVLYFVSLEEVRALVLYLLLEYGRRFQLFLFCLLRGGACTCSIFATRIWQKILTISIFCQTNKLTFTVSKRRWSVFRKFYQIRL